MSKTATYTASANVLASFRANASAFVSMTREKLSGPISVNFIHCTDNSESSFTIYHPRELDQLAADGRTLRPFIIRARYEHWRVVYGVSEAEGNVSTAKDIYAYAVADLFRDEAYRELGRDNLTKATKEQADARIDAARRNLAVAIVRHVSTLEALRDKIGPEGASIGITELY